jgi:c-di-GMP-binding flagellar brake protein YcgR
MNDGLEKRTFQRLEYPIEVTVKIVPVNEVLKDLPPLHIKSRNISKCGICLETKSIEVEGTDLLSGAPFAREYRLHMNIELIPNEPLFEAIGEVRWYDIAPEIPEYICRLGVAFIDIKNNGEKQLSRFLKKYKSNQGYFHNFFR